jgi:PAS domain S-box-containing protein
MKSNKEFQIGSRLIWLMFYLFFSISIFAGLSDVSGNEGAYPSILTDNEKAWLKAHPIIKLAPDPEFKPIEFFDEKGIYSGVAADYAQLLEKKLGIKFEIVQCADWDDVTQRIKNREVDVLNAVVKTPQREAYLTFPPPYLKLPSVIIARKSVNAHLTLEMLKGMKIVMVSGYGYVDLIRNKYPDLNIELVPELKTALRKVSFGMVDAFVGDMATTSFYIESEGITNLKLVGETDPPNISGFAIRSDWPELNDILGKGMAQINKDEKKAIYQKWLYLAVEPGMSIKEFKRYALIATGIIICIIASFLILNRQLKRSVNLKTKDLKREIDEHRRTEQSLQESQNRYKSLIENQTELVCVFNNDGEFTFVNQVFCIFFNKSKNELIGKEWKSLSVAEDISIIQEKWMTLAPSNKAVVIENRVCSGEGKIHWMQFVNKGFFDESGNLIEIQSVGRDITERKKAEEALEQSETYLRTLINTIPDLVWLKNEAGIYLFCNSRFERFFGAKEEKIVGKTDYDFVDKALADFFRKHDKLAMAKGAPSINEEEVTYADDGHHEILETIKMPLHDSEGQLIGVLGIARDITERKYAEDERKKLEGQLRQSQKMESVGSLAGGIAHDFNNILFPIVGHTEMLLEDVSADSPFRDGLNQIYAGALRASELVKQILTFSRQKSGELKLIKIQHIMKEALKLIRSTTPTTIEIKQDIKTDCGVIKADPTQIHQIIINLTTNAHHAMEKTGGELKVSLMEVDIGELDLIDPDIKSGTYACLSVTDTGKGMNKELIQKIFDPFFTTKEKSRGTGMGLAVVHGIVKNMGGAIQVYSELGKGSEFKIYFPIETSSFDQQSIKMHETIQGGMEQILLIDDETAILTMEKQLLERLGYHVTSHTSSLKALEVFRDSPDKFDLVITDMAMPNMPGDKLSAELTKIRSDIPILLCTGFSETLFEEKAESLGINGFLLKPIVMKNLSHKIREVLDKN